MHIRLARHFMLCLFLTAPAPTEISTLSLHDALPISVDRPRPAREPVPRARLPRRLPHPYGRARGTGDRKSTRLNSSHRCISYAVFCLKKKKEQIHVQEAAHYTV